MPTTSTPQPADEAAPRARRIRPEVIGAGAAAVASLAIVATIVAAAITGFGSSVERQLPIGVLVSVLAGLALPVAGAWLVGASRPLVSVGLAVTTICLVAPPWASWPLLPTWTRAAALALAPLAVAGTAQVALAWSPAVGRRRAVAAAYVLVAAGALVHLLAFNPFAEPGCSTVCIDVDPVVGNLLDPRSALAVTALLTASAALVSAAAVVRVRVPQIPGPVAGAVLAALAALPVPLVVRWVQWGDQQVSDLLLILPAAAAALVGAAVTVVAVRARRTRASMMRLVAHLGESATATGDLEEVVGGVQFAVPDEGRWVDAMGRPVAAVPREDQHVVVAGPSGPVLRFLFTDGRDRDGVAEALTPALRLSLMNAQLAAVRRARVAEVQASRRRIVAASDAERLRIERDLHDGAQQRLVGAAFYLNVAQGRLADDTPFLAEATASVYDALSHLRRLAHGVFPGTLATEGLWGALDELARTSLASVTLELDGDDDVPSAVAMAAYSMVAAVVEHAERTSSTGAVRVSARRGTDALLVSLDLAHHADAAEPPDLTDVADRIGAVGGDMSISATAWGTLLEAEIPSAS